MSRIGTRKLILVLPVLMILPLIGCSKARKPNSTPAAAQQAQPELDIKTVIRDFLGSLPSHWNQAPARDLTNTQPFVVDVRQPEEFAEGTLGGALNIPLRTLARNLQALPPMDTDIVLVCSNGHRSAIAMAVLQMLGYKKARSLEGGLRQWPPDLPKVIAPASPRHAAGQIPNSSPQLQAILDYYLVHTLPVDWGALSPAGLTEDQQRKSSTELDPMAETFDQGRSVLVDVDEPDEFARAHLYKALNFPLRSLTESLKKIPLSTMVNWA